MCKGVQDSVREDADLVHKIQASCQTKQANPEAVSATWRFQIQLCHMLNPPWLLGKEASGGVSGNGSGQRSTCLGAAVGPAAGLAAGPRQWSVEAAWLSKVRTLTSGAGDSRLWGCYFEQGCA